MALIYMILASVMIFIGLQILVTTKEYTNNNVQTLVSRQGQIIYSTFVGCSIGLGSGCMAKGIAIIISVLTFTLRHF